MPTILVIEDEVYMRKSIRQVLGYAGYETLEACNGEIGVQIAAEQLPDLIISDVMMPEMDGYGVLETLRNEPRTATIPIILLTSLSQNSSMRQGMELGADDYLSKPVAVKDLVAAVEAQFEKQKRRVEAQTDTLKTLRRNIIYALPHEMRTPLQQIVGFASLLEMDSEKDDNTRESAQHILKASARLERIIENYLIYAQIELIASDPAEVDKLRNYVTESAEGVISDAAHSRADERQRLSDLSIRVQPLTLCISPENLAKIVTELVDNALKFSRPGQPVVVQSAHRDGQPWLEIVDHGCGMDATQIRSMDAYMQFDRTLHEQPGLGLGYAVAHRLVEVHGGAIYVESEPGSGTRVSLYLPSA